MKWLCLLVLAACSKDLLSELPDAAPPADASPYCGTPSQPLAPGATKIFLSTEGITLSRCGDDARTNCTSLVKADNTAIPPFASNASIRASYIADIVAQTQEQLAPYSVDIVTTRPSSGDYYMFVLGGDPVQITGGCAGCTSQALFNCHEIHNAVDLIFDRGADEPAYSYVTSILSDVGALQGITASSVHGDCECRFDPGCDAPVTGVCTFGVDTPVSANPDVSCGRVTQDEPAMLKAALGCRE